MAITIVATVGSATANSYVTLAEANSFVEGLTQSDDVVASVSYTHLTLPTKA